METKRAFTAVMLSLLILLGYQYIFMPKPQEPTTTSQIAQNQDNTRESLQQTTTVPGSTIAPSSQPLPVNTESAPLAAQNITTTAGRDIPIETSLFKAIISENGGGFKSFKLKKYKENIKKDSPLKELIFTDNPLDFPLTFAWGNGLPASPPIFQADKEQIFTSISGQQTLTMTAILSPGVSVQRTMIFTDSSYLIEVDYTVSNNSKQALQGAPYLRTTNRPFTPGSKSDRFLFNGTGIYSEEGLTETKTADLLDDGPQSHTGNIRWAAYEDTYFLCGILPNNQGQMTVELSASEQDKVYTDVIGSKDILEPGSSQNYNYSIFFGPKKLAVLQEVGHDLERIINFGWFDMIAKPALHLLNFFYKYFHNYGVAIILVTILFKLLFWPISHKGMKSMKNMQKIQPKMTKLREKFKDDKDRLNREMINLYKTYKVNPLGGCLPMVLQIPVFFALYKVLLQTIELRHAPFVFWITDLAAPDRLFIGFDIPMLGGIPVLTLLMGGSMFLQQKMTPSPADPAQAKVMLFLPVVFTFMFLNFASGLVLYWFLNNLLSIGQQYFINRSVDA